MYIIGFIGSGKMATALIAGLLDGKIATRKGIICSDVLGERLDEVKNRFGVRVTEDNTQVFLNSDVVVLAFKPQNFPEAISGLQEFVREDHLIISILAGVRIETIEQLLPGRVVRVMPNAACLVGEMAAGFAGGTKVGPADMKCVREILACGGIAYEVKEEQLDAVTGLSGSGPAFVAYLIESFIAAGQTAGLDKEAARALAIKTFEGTARLLSDWQMEPAELIEMVSSPKGTTVAGREILESSDVAEVIKKTILRAAQRSRELGK